MSNPTTWRYAPCRLLYPDGTEGWDIRRLFYEGDTLVGWSAERIDPYGDTQKELVKDIELMVYGLSNPPLVLHVFECEKCHEQDARPESGLKICVECANDE